MLEVHHLTAFYGNSQALFDVRLSVGRGELVSLLGRNGMGKTTTVNCIMGLLPSAAGVIDFDNRSLKGCASHQVAQSGIGIVPEGRGIFPNLTVDEQLQAFALHFQGVLQLFEAAAQRGVFPGFSQIVLKLFFVFVQVLLQGIFLRGQRGALGIHPLLANGVPVGQRLAELLVFLLIYLMVKPQGVKNESEVQRKKNQNEARNEARGI